MFGRKDKSPEPAARLRCSFCNKSQDDVRKLIAGPTVYICDECVDVCVEILADDRRASRDSEQPLVIGAKPTPRPWPLSDAWCAFCGKVAELETALMIEDRTLLCEACVQAIAAAATEARQGRESSE